MTQSATDFVPVAKTSDIAPGKMKLVKAGNEFILLSNVEGKFYAIGAICTHMGALLTDGMVDEDEVLCPDHASRYNLKTGRVVPDMMSKKNVPQYVLQIKGDEIYLSPKPLDLPERKPFEATQAAAPAAAGPAAPAVTAPVQQTAAPVPSVAPVTTTSHTAAKPVPAQTMPAPLRPPGKRQRRPSLLETFRGTKMGAATLDIVEGKFLGHPNHALLIHFPSALFPISLLFDLMSYFMDGAALSKAAFYTLAVGIFFVLPSMLTGFLDYFGMPKGSEQKNMATTHWIINSLASAILLVSLLLRLTDLDAPRSELLGTAISFVGVSLMIVGNYFGADLIFRMGMRVHRGGPPAPVAVMVSKMLKSFRKS